MNSLPERAEASTENNCSPDANMDSNNPQLIFDEVLFNELISNRLLNLINRLLRLKARNSSWMIQ